MLYQFGTSNSQPKKTSTTGTAVPQHPNLPTTVATALRTTANSIATTVGGGGGDSCPYLFWVDLGARTGGRGMHPAVRVTVLVLSTRAAGIERQHRDVGNVEGVRRLKHFAESKYCLYGP